MLGRLLVSSKVRDLSSKPLRYSMQDRSSILMFFMVIIQFKINLMYDNARIIVIHWPISLIVNFFIHKISPLKECTYLLVSRLSHHAKQPDSSRLKPTTNLSSIPSRRRTALLRKWSNTDRKTAFPKRSKSEDTTKPKWAKMCPKTMCIVG